MRFSESFLRQARDRVSLADYAGRKLSWDKRKSVPARGDYWACCPFHQEKSPSFHVLDGKGIYNCFGCGEKGDIFTLAMKLEGVSFPEAVARVAELAGMPLPADNREDDREAGLRKRLYAVLARAAKLYGEALRGREGADARRYLEGRGLGPEIWAQFGIGYAPGGYTWSIDRLKAEGYALEELSAAGLAYPGDDGRRPVDVFRERVTFEIADAGGKVIAFGGRALAKDAKAKYLNSPETPVFHKGRTLYRLKQARELASKTKAKGLVVAEGYLDVVAFERAGIAAVAPLGTALTEDQLQLVWRSGSEPILCFDGDTAGARAADKALDLALPHLGPERTVRIALLPAGEDPDDLYRRAGPQALAPVLDAARPAAEALFAREQNRRPLEAPEARAAFKAGLREAINKIADPDTKQLYFSDLMGRADALAKSAGRPPRPAFEPGRRPYNPKFAPPAAASPELQAKSRTSNRVAAEDFLRAAVDYPALLQHEDWIDRLVLPDPDLEAIRSALQALSAENDASTAIDRTALSRHLTQIGEERAAARVTRWPKPRVAGSEGGRPPEAGGGPDSLGAGELEAEWLALVMREVVLPAIKDEMAALRDAADAGDDDAFIRFQALGREAREIEARARTAKGEPDSSELGL